MRTISWLVVSKRNELHNSFAEIHEILPRKHPTLGGVALVLQHELGASSLEERLKQLAKLSSTNQIVYDCSLSKSFAVF